MLIVDSDEEGPSNSATDGSGDDKARKRKLEENEGASTKKCRLEQAEDLDDVIALD